MKKDAEKMSKTQKEAERTASKSGFSLTESP